MPTFGERLRELRQKAGLTQEALADASGLSLGSIRNYEQDVREPYWAGIFRLADSLGVSCDAFKDCVAPGLNQKGRAKKGSETRSKGRPRKPSTAAQETRSAGKASEDTATPKRPPRGKRKGKEE
jgi:transcriptional regulator with XRE-family HTH domain